MRSPILPNLDRSASALRQGRRPGAARRLVTAAAVVALPLTMAACTDNAAPSSTAGAAGPIQVTSTSDACKVSTATAMSGNLTFTVKNDGDQVTEFYLLAEDGLRILGEVENIGPGLTRNLVVTVPAGKYTTACKPGMVGDGIRAAFDVADSGTQPAVDKDLQALTDQGTAQYVAYVKDQTEQLVVGTKKFAEAYAAGDAASRKELYAATRMHWERIEPVAESFGDLDPKLDAREADLAEGEEWTGWHRAEKDLYPPAGFQALSAAEREKLSAQLVADTEELAKRTRDGRADRGQAGQRRQGAAGRSGHGQGHRRRGSLVAHRPVGLPGQRGRRPDRVRDPPAGAGAEGSGARQDPRYEVRGAAG